MRQHNRPCREARGREELERQGKRGEERKRAVVNARRSLQSSRNKRSTEKNKEGGEEEETEHKEKEKSEQKRKMKGKGEGSRPKRTIILFLIINDDNLGRAI